METEKDIGVRPYAPHLYYKLYRAMEDEGYAASDMVFDRELTFVSDLGFFTVRMIGEIPQLVHFLVWPEKRTWHNSIRHYREMRTVLIDLGYTMAIMAQPKNRPDIKTCIELAAGRKNIEPYSESASDFFYLVRFGRRYENLQPLNH